MKKVLDFISQQQECVVSTVGSDGAPESAVVGFSENDKLELMFGTFSGSRKYKNLVNDPRVSVVIGFEGNITIQYEGEARQLSGDELAERQETHFAKLPAVKKYASEPGQVYFSVQPKWVRYTDYSKQPWDIEEQEF